MRFSLQAFILFTCLLSYILWLNIETRYVWGLLPVERESLTQTCHMTGNAEVRGGPSYTGARYMVVRGIVHGPPLRFLVMLV